MQTILAALIVAAALGVLTRKLWRTARAGSSCSCSNDCDGCTGCPAQAAVRNFGADSPRK
jgi:hypothetical protein